MHYSPNANDGRGRVTLTFDGESASLDLREGLRKGNTLFDRFGFVSWHVGGHFVEIYFDDLTFSDSGAQTTRQ